MIFMRTLCGSLGQTRMYSRTVHWLDVRKLPYLDLQALIWFWCWKERSLGVLCEEFVSLAGFQDA